MTVGDITPFSNVIVDSLSPVKVNSTLERSDGLSNKENKTGFNEVLDAAMAAFNETNNLQKLADIAQQDFATGKNDNMLSVLMAEQKALTSLDLTVQLTGKIIESYREIMRIQL